MSEQSNIISYENPSLNGKTLKPNYLLLWFSSIVAGVGLFIMIMSNLYVDTVWPKLGTFWLVFGFFATSILAIIAFVDIIRSCFVTRNRTNVILRCIFIFLVILANFPIAALCVIFAKMPPSVSD